jgi:hypothetical protein
MKINMNEMKNKIDTKMDDMKNKMDENIQKFEGTKVFTWVKPIEQYFELHNIMDDKKKIHIENLNFEIKPYQWYQWVVKNNPHFIIILGVYLQDTYKHNMGNFGNITTLFNCQKSST